MLFYRTPLTGNLLPEGTLCLTYDDGPARTQASMPAPGPRTDDLGFYLFLQGIPATFFAIGQRAASEPELCQQLMHMGHAVENHTETHYGLPWQSDAAIVADVLDAASSIGEAKNPDSLLLRPPYAAWSDGVASALNSDPEARKLTGPVLGDIGANDWTFWQDSTKTPGQQLADCVADYLNQIHQARRGIIIMHDCSAPFQTELTAANQTFELTRLLIPQLIAEGYRFIRLDAVPQIRSAMLVSSILGLKATSGLYVSPQGGGGGGILANGPALNAWEELGLVQAAGGKQAFRTPNGQFMSTQPSGVILANGNGVYSWELFEIQDQNNGQVALLAHNGKYVSAPNSGPIVAAATTIGPEELFTLEYVP